MNKPTLPLIDLQNIAKTYYSEDIQTIALAEVHLQVAAGDYLAITGPSGCGKSTLLSILGLLELPSEGAYLLDNQTVSALDANSRAKIRNRDIGFIFQAFNLIGDLNVFENVEIPLTYRNTSGRKVRRTQVMDALSRVNMTHRVKHFPSQLSGGQQQRVAVARALVCQPGILLADEPTGNLDSKNGRIVMDLLAELNDGGSTICMVTHNPDFAREARRTVAMFDGRIVDET